MAATPLLFDGTWLQRAKYEDSEAFYQRKVAGTSNSGGEKSSGRATTSSSVSATSSNLKTEIAQARQNITNALKDEKSETGAGNTQILGRLQNLETENSNLRKVAQDLQALVTKLESRVAALEKAGSSPNTSSDPPQEATLNATPAEDSDSDFLFDASESEDDEETKAALAAYQARKDNKPKVIAKSNVIFDVKPWDDETDMAKLEEHVRSITMDGLLWGAGQFKPVGYGIKKLQITCVVEDDKVSTEELEEMMCAFEDYIQSVDVVAFNKI